MAAITAGKMIKSGVDKRKARQEHEKEYNKLMSQEFGMTPTARKFINEPVSASVRQQFIDQLDKSAGTTISALSKGGSRMLGQGANVMESLNRSALDMAQLEQQYRASALGLGAQQEMQGRSAQQSLMAQNVAGLAQREMQAQMEQNQIMQDTIRNLAYMGMNGGFEGMFKTGGVTDNTQTTPTQPETKTPEMGLSELERQQNERERQFYERQKNLPQYGMGMLPFGSAINAMPEIPQTFPDFQNILFMPYRS